MRKLLIATVLLVMLTVGVGVASAGQEVCPNGAGWTKVDAPDSTISGTTISFSIPTGTTVTAVCVKASTDIHNWAGTATAHFSWNIGGQHDVSHYSYFTEVETQDETYLNLSARPSGCDTINVVVSWLGVDEWADVEVFITGTSGYVQRFENQMTGSESFVLLRNPGTYTITADLLYRTNPYEVTDTKEVTVTIQPCYEPGDPRLVILNDCEGFDVIYIPDGKQEVGYSLFSGTWNIKNVLEVAQFPGDERLELEPFDIFEPEYCYECVPDKVVHFWTDGWCMFRDRTYPDNASWMVNPPVFAQNAYCGCGYVPFGEWGIVEVNDCDPDGYQYWTEIPEYCGFTNCN